MYHFIGSQDVRAGTKKENQTCIYLNPKYTSASLHGPGREHGLQARAFLHEHALPLGRLRNISTSSSQLPSTRADGLAVPAELTYRAHRLPTLGKTGRGCAPLPEAICLLLGLLASPADGFQLKD